MSDDAPIVVVGGGFTGLAAAFELAKRGHKVEVLEAEDDFGGLAGTFEVLPGVRLEKFYHHWFTSDSAVLDLANELGLGAKLKRNSSRNGLFYANSIYRLSSPAELLNFTPIPFIDRVRTGLMALYARRIKKWQGLEKYLAKDWIRKIGGRRAFEVIWQPLLKGKFGSEADNVSAVWFWNKLKLRGSSRGKEGREELIYLEGGFNVLINELKKALQARGVVLRSNTRVAQILSEDRKVKGVLTSAGSIPARAVLATVPLPVFLQLTPELPPQFRERARQVRFLGNVCLVLRLKRSLSETYWLNVADPNFPFVGVIEHTNFDALENYRGEHIAYISKYLPTQDALFKKSDEEYFEYCLPYIKKIFPEFERDWVNGYKIWRANFSQPVITQNYSQIVPEAKTPIKNLWLATMAQVYPEDRGTNYAVRDGIRVAREMSADLV